VEDGALEYQRSLFDPTSIRNPLQGSLKTSLNKFNDQKLDSIPKTLM